MASEVFSAREGGVNPMNARNAVSGAVNPLERRMMALAEAGIWKRRMEIDNLLRSNFNSRAWDWNVDREGNVDITREGNEHLITATYNAETRKGNVFVGTDGRESRDNRRGMTLEEMIDYAKKMHRKYPD